MGRVTTIAAAMGLLFPLSAHANETILSLQEAQAQGYTEIVPTGVTPGATIPAEHSLPWPAKFLDAQHKIGNTMAEFQPYLNSPYYHMGVDIRTVPGEDVFAPIDGRLEAGHNVNVVNPDGSITRYWKPWPQHGDVLTFKVVVVATNGTRYEFNHIDESTLPGFIIDKLNAGNSTVIAGQKLGHVIAWPTDNYDHTHYNVVLSSGVVVNPEYVSPIVADSIPPKITNLYAIKDNGNVINFGTGVFSQVIKEFVVEALDHQDSNIYDHPPVLVKLVFVTGEKTVWDFRQTLTGQDGNFPPIWQFYRESIVDPNGSTHVTTGAYGVGKSLIRLKVPAGAHGSFTIVLEDEAGNATMRNGIIP